MSHTTARHLALMAALLSGLPAAAMAQDDINQDNTAYGTTSAEFLLFGAGARGTALGRRLLRHRDRRERAVLQSRPVWR